MYPGSFHIETYHKPVTYTDQATIQTVNAGMPYYVSSPKYGYEGEHIPVAGSVSMVSSINEQTGILSTGRESTSLWVTCTASRYQFDRPFKRCSLSDDGVIHNTYSPRMAFTNMFSALYYAETGKLNTSST